VAADISGGSFNITLPTTPADKTIIGVKIVKGTSAANGYELTISAGGSDVFDVAGGSNSQAMYLLNQAITYIYNASGGIWSAVQGNLPRTRIGINRTVSQNAVYTASSGDIVMATAGSSGWTLTLPAVGLGNQVLVKKIDSGAGTITILPSSGTIDGASSATLVVQYDSLWLESDGTNWFILNSWVGNTAQEAIVRNNSLNQFQTATGNYSMGNFTLTNLPAATATGQPLAYSQIPTGDTPGTISVTGTNPPVISNTGVFGDGTSSHGKVVQAVAATTGGAVELFYNTTDAYPFLSISNYFTVPTLSFGPGGSSATDAYVFRSTLTPSTVQANSALAITGVNGTTTVQRFAGMTASGAPTSGVNKLFYPNDIVYTASGQTWICAPISGTTGPITGVTNSGVTVTITAANNLVAGQTVSITSITGFTTNNPNGTWTVLSSGLSATAFQVTVSTAPTGTYTSGGNVGVWGPVGASAWKVYAASGSPNTATVPSSKDVVTVLNYSSGGALQITIATSSPTPVDGQKIIAKVIDATSSPVTLTWVNTQNSTVNVPGTSSGSTTKPLTVGFIYNALASAWTCVGAA
jgi:hypothetical protein